jgi:hypothetical protein
MVVSSATERILITNCDNAVGASLCREILTGKYHQNFPFVKAGVQNVSRSGDLWAMGACVVEINKETNAETMKKHFHGVQSLLLVPALGHREMVDQAHQVLKAAKESNVQNCYVLSIAGADET